MRIMEHLEKTLWPAPPHPKLTGTGCLRVRLRVNLMHNGHLAWMAVILMSCQEILLWKQTWGRNPDTESCDLLCLPSSGAADIRLGPKITSRLPGLSTFNENHSFFLQLLGSSLAYRAHLQHGSCYKVYPRAQGLWWGEAMCWGLWRSWDLFAGPKESSGKSFKAPNLKHGLESWSD